MIQKIPFSKVRRMYFLLENRGVRCTANYTLSLISMMPLHKIHVVFVPTFSCNYHCPYCLINKEKYVNKYPKIIPYNKWVKAFSKLSSAVIDITGGEPFCYPKLIQLVEKLPRKHRVMITTNLSFPVDRFKKIGRDIGITASFHSYEADINSFKSKIVELKEAGFNLTINFVGYPAKMHLIPRLKTFFENLGVTFNVDPYIDPDYEYTKKEIEILKKYIQKKRKLGFDFRDNKPKKCKAGLRHFMIVPNGDVYTCHAGFFYTTSNLHKEFRAKKEEFYMGNLFDGSFRPLKKDKICSYPCSEACDLDYAQPKYLNKASFQSD